MTNSPKGLQNTKSPAELSPEERGRIISRATAVGIWGNILLSTYKLAAGILGHSGAMLSDAIHSFSDVLATFVAWIGVRMAEEKADRDHPYGHERFECVASIILAIILFTTAFGIGYGQFVKIISHGSGTQPVPGKIAFVAAIISIIVKELMYHYTAGAAKRIRSTALKAEAWHHRSDALSSVGSFAGILGARLGLPWADAAASLIICLFIVKVAVDIFRESVTGVLDTACDEATQTRMREVILSRPGVMGVDLLNTRLFGNRMFVDVEISADGTQSLESAHHIAEDVHDAIEQTFGTVKHCMVHVNPCDPEDKAENTEPPEDSFSV